MASHLQSEIRFISPTESFSLIWREKLGINKVRDMTTSLHSIVWPWRKKDSFHSFSLHQSSITSVCYLLYTVKVKGITLILINVNNAIRWVGVNVVLNNFTCFLGKSNWNRPDIYPEDVFVCFRVSMSSFRSLTYRFRSLLTLFSLTICHYKVHKG